MPIDCPFLLNILCSVFQKISHSGFSGLGAEFDADRSKGEGAEVHQAFRQVLIH